MKTKLFTLAIAFVVLFTTQIKAQSDEYRSTVTLNTGYSLIGNLLNATGNNYEVESFSIPAIQATYDFSLVKWFSAGAAVSYQLMGYEYTDYGANNEDFKTTIHRTNFAVRGLFHYGKNDMLDMYSGVRFGITNWAFKTDYEGDD